MALKRERFRLLAALELERSAAPGLSFLKSGEARLAESERQVQRLADFLRSADWPIEL